VGARQDPQLAQLQVHWLEAQLVKAWINSNSNAQ
jgi:hypothetical protein